MNAATTAPEAPAAQMQPLSALACGDARVVAIEAHDADARRLMALGLCIGRRVHIIKTGDPLIVRVVGAQVGISARLAASILVQPASMPSRPQGEP